MMTSFAVVGTARVENREEPTDLGIGRGVTYLGSLRERKRRELQTIDGDVTWKLG